MAYGARKEPEEWSRGQAQRVGTNPWNGSRVSYTEQRQIQGLGPLGKGDRHKE